MLQRLWRRVEFIKNQVNTELTAAQESNLMIQKSPLHPNPVKTLNAFFPHFLIIVTQCCMNSGNRPVKGSALHQYYREYLQRSILILLYTLCRLQASECSVRVYYRWLICLHWYCCFKRAAASCSLWFTPSAANRPTQLLDNDFTLEGTDPETFSYDAVRTRSCGLVC